MSVCETAIGYLQAGLCVLPAILGEKRPALPGWKQYQTRLPTEQQLQTWFATDTAVCVLGGAVSGNLEMIDFDQEGELFDAWCDLVATEAPTLLDRVVVESSQSGGRHVIYRCQEPIPGNRKLAQRTLVVPTGDQITIGGKSFLPHRAGDRFEVTLTLIETRGEGGLFLCAPTAGYVLQQGSLCQPPVLDAAERAILIEAACALNEALPPTAHAPLLGTASSRPGDDFNERGDIREILVRHGWQLAQTGDNEYWRRPGKEQGWSATLRGRVLYVFSSNAAPFEPDRAYSPFAVYAMLDHGGDFVAAATAIRLAGFGTMLDTTVDLSGFVGTRSALPAAAVQSERSDPGPIPESMCRIPGFVSDVMDHCLATAPYPNVPLAFCGALALQALLAGRKVRDEADNRTNIYLLALAYSAVGKDWPRKINTAILHKIGLIDTLGEKFASGEGIQDALLLNPSLLFQTDEIDSLLQSMNKARDARHENILSTLLTMYSAANSIYPMRRKAGKEAPGVIDQPNLVIFGTAIPNHYYGALSERMLTNGFFARMLIVESGRRSLGQEPGLIDPSSHLLDTAQWWSDYNPGKGNLGGQHPTPRVVLATDAAKQLLRDGRLQAEAEYSLAETRGDAVGTTVWGRVQEQTRKLALLYAVSADHTDPVIDADAVGWANGFVMHQTRRMLFMAHGHVAENPFHGDCLKLVKKLREATDQQLPHSMLLKRMKLDSKTFQVLIETMVQQGDIEMLTVKTAGRTGLHYRLSSEVSLASETSRPTSTAS